MDACLDLLVPRIHVPAGVDDVTSRWAGENEVVPRIFRFGDIELRAYRAGNAPDLVLRHLPPGYVHDDWWIITAGSVLDALEHVSGPRGVRGEPERIAAMLLELLEPVSAWALAFQPECERIDEVIIGTREAAVERLLASIHPPSRIGFLAYGG